MSDTRTVYLDYSATTPVKQEVVEEMIPYFTEKFGNASSIYSFGFVAKDALEEARTRVAALINADPKEIFFTSGGTEADNWALISLARKLRHKGNHLITTKIEHHAILHTCDQLVREGFEVTSLDVDLDGRIDLEQLKDSIRPETTLISIMFANNEMGAVQPIEEIGKIAKEHGILFHTDAVQALGNVPIDVRAMNIDLLSMSSHKIYGPKGVGALFVRRGVNIPTYIQGGAQESKKRAGTENIPGIVGFGKAAEIARVNFDSHVKHVSGLRDHFVERVLKEIPMTHLNGGMEHRHPGNANITFELVEGESILLYLDAAGISASSGSACSSRSLKPSHVLTAMGIPVVYIHGSIRFTFGDPTTLEDVDYTVERLKELITRLREITSMKQGDAID